MVGASEDRWHAKDWRRAIYVHTHETLIRRNCTRTHGQRHLRNISNIKSKGRKIRAALARVRLGSLLYKALYCGRPPGESAWRRLQDAPKHLQHGGPLHAPMSRGTLGSRLGTCGGP
eukprot:CAMPEP_0176189800 /NCGR_PEP_ID=MMETSP0121_2-20121125/3614_1 /TAXON_ID=160619 /ORGANISM="Kryptoperidinium foliaceum, Strain CCMP 1326" /LENGTH=116 /DNA_ID=CAMNT_0017528411 /DNA_START=115 /DNA_END=461 /DNA_ORIENTATION=+